MKFIVENYLIMILVGLFFVFALIGYLIDIIRKNNEIDKNELSIDVKTIEIPNKITEVTKPTETGKAEDADELLKNYNENINE